MPTFPASILFKAKDEVSGKVRRMGRSVNRTFKLMGASVKRLDRQLDKLGGRAAGTLGLLGVGGAAFVAQRALKAAIITGADFEQTLVNAAAKFPEGIRRGTIAFMELEKAAGDVGRATIFSASEAAQGLNFLAMAGFNAEQSIAALPIVTTLAIASQTELGEATDIASDALGAFGLASKDADTQAANLSRIVDVMAKTVTTANTDMNGLFESMKEGGPVATSVGANIETFAALTGELANAGIKGSRAGTTLKNVFLKLAAPTGKGAGALKRLGVQTQDSEGNMRDIVDILGDLGDSLDGLGSAQRAGVLETIFGKIPIAGVNVLLQSGSERLNEYRKQLENAGGAANTMADVMSDTVTASFKTLMSSMESAGISIFKLNRGAIAELIESATGWVRAFESAIETNKELAEEMQGNLFLALSGGAKLAFGFIGALIALKTVVLAGQAAIFLYNTAMGVYKVATIAAGIATKGFRIAMFLLNTAFRLSPIGLIVTGIGLLAAGAVALIANWEPIKEFFVGLWDSILSGIDSVLAAFETLTNPFSMLTEGVGGLFDNIGSIFGGDEGGTNGTPPELSSPEMRMASSLKETVTTNRTEVTIADQTGRASIKGRGSKLIKLIDSSEF